jgi:nicotinate-nucleotide adenylyltransferase
VRILYGGTFDPVHLGHLAIGDVVARALHETVWLLPAADPPHRAAPGASAEQRATMLDLAVDGHPRLRVDRRELRRDGPSFTVDTLREVRAEIGPGMALAWILGLDSLVQLASWHDWRSIFTLTHVIGVQRPGTEIGLDWLAGRDAQVHAEVSARAVPVERLAESAFGCYSTLPMVPLRMESASGVRQAIALERPWQHMVPPPVAGYIREHGLYGAAGPGPGV